MLADLALRLFERWARPAGTALAILAAAWFMRHEAYHAGYEARSSELNAAVAQQAIDQAEQLRKNVADARSEDLRLIAQLSGQNNEQRAIAAKLRARLADQANLPVDPHDPSRPLLGQCVLDPESVRLLNQARAAATVGAASGAAVGADAQGRAAAASSSPVSGGEFADNDLEVVRLYKDLAARHDQLVDWVNSKLSPRR
jgi:hypothetical protein